MKLGMNENTWYGTVLTSYEGSLHMRQTTNGCMYDVAYRPVLNQLMWQSMSVEDTFGDAMDDPPWVFV